MRICEKCGSETHSTGEHELEEARQFSKDLTDKYLEASGELQIKLKIANESGKFWERAATVNREEIERLREALTPFALYGKQFVERDDAMTPVVSSGNQSLIIAAFQQAVAALEAKP